MSLSRASAAPGSPVSGSYAAYVPRLLDEPWDGARIAASSVVFCDLAWVSATPEELGSRLDAALDDLIAAAESHGGDVLSFSSDAITLLFTGEGRQGRAINAVHSMHGVVADAHGDLSMSAGIASGLVHLITAGDDPRQLIAAGPTVTRALEMQALAGTGDTRGETVDRSALETPGKTSATSAETFIAPAVRGLIDADQTDPGYRQATVGFGIFSGVDRALQRNPAKAAQQIGEVVEAVQRAAADHGVTALGVDPSRDGGRFTLSTGVTAPNQDGEERMIRFAKAVLNASPPFTLRFGIATGEALAGILGGPTRKTFAVVGATVDLAARLAASASPGEVLTTHRAIDRATTRYAISEWDPVTFKGIDAQVVPVVVGSELSDEGGMGAGGLVGRSEEQATLRRLIDELRSGRGGVVEIVGDAGIGKSRLVSESLRDSDVATVVVRAEEYRRSMPYGAASRLLRAAMGIDEHEDPERAGVLLRAQVRELTPYLEPLLPLIAEVAEAEVEPTKAVDELSVAFHRERTQWAISQLSVWLTRRPIVIQIEDAHWIDAASADLLSYVLARGSDLPWLVISTRRPGDSGWIAGDGLHPTRIDLEPLAPGALRALLTELRRDDPLPPDLASDLIERSGGNPYLLERLAAAAGWVDHLPGNVEVAAAIQLEHLDPADREVLLDLAVLGRRFDPDLAEEVVGVEDWSVFADVLQAEWDGRLRFRQPILHDAAYASLPAERRRDLHLRTGVALAGRSAGAEVLSEHFGRAGADKKAWETGRLAGTRALERNAPLEAATLLGRALASSRRVASLPIAPRAETAELLGDAWCRAGHFKEGEKAYLAAEELAKTRGDRARLLHKRALLRKREGRYPAALRMLTTALKSLPRAAGPGERAELELAYAGVRLHQGRYREAIERCELAIPLADKGGDLTTLGGAYFVRARATSHLEAGSGVEDAGRALDIFESTGDHLMQARVLDMLGAEAYHRGQWDEALALAGRSAEQRDLAGDAVGSAVAGYHRARVLLDQGKLEEAESALEEIRTASRTANYPLGVAMSTMHLAGAMARGGDSAAALGLLKETLDLFVELDAERCVVFNRLAQAEAHLLDGGVETALADAEEALDEAMGITGVDAPVVGLQRVRGVALVWLGRSSDGHVQLLEALELARRANAVFEQALILDALATLYGDDGAAEEREAIVERLGIVRLPPFLTP